MELRQIRYFESVARHRNFTRAAEELSIVQPALSQQIKHLEHELGIELLDRRGGKVTVTSAGMAFLRRAESILAEVSAVASEMQAFSQAVVGQVSLGAVPSLSAGALNLPLLFKRFGAAHPSVHLIYTEATSRVLVGLLRRGQCDVALIDETLIADTSDLTTELVTEEEQVVIVAPNHPLASREFCRVEDLAHERFIRLGGLTASRQLELVRCAEAAGFTPNFAYHAGSVHLARSIVSEGLGIHVTHPWVGEGEGPPVVKVRLVGAPMICRIVVAQMRDAYRSPSINAFLSFASDTFHFRDRAPEIRLVAGGSKGRR